MEPNIEWAREKITGLAREVFGDTPSNMLLNTLTNLPVDVSIRQLKTIAKNKVSEDEYEKFCLKLDAIFQIYKKTPANFLISLNEIYANLVEEINMKKVERKGMGESVPTEIARLPNLSGIEVEDDIEVLDDDNEEDEYYDGEELSLPENPSNEDLFMDIEVEETSPLNRIFLGSMNEEQLKRAWDLIASLRSFPPFVEITTRLLEMISECGKIRFQQTECDLCKAPLHVNESINEPVVCQDCMKREIAPLYGNEIGNMTPMEIQAIYRAMRKNTANARIDLEDLEPLEATMILSVLGELAEFHPTRKFAVDTGSDILEKYKVKIRNVGCAKCGGKTEQMELLSSLKEQHAFLCNDCTEKELIELGFGKEHVESMTSREMELAVNACNIMRDHEPKKIIVNDLINLVTDIAKKFRGAALRSIQLHTNRNNLKKGNIGKQDLIDAIIVEFIANIVESFGVKDFEIHVNDLISETKEGKG